MTTQLKPQTEVNFLGARARVLASGDETGGAFGLVEMIEVPARDMPPLHIHHNEDEGFYLVNGSLSLFMPDRQVDLEPGDFVLAPRGVPHVYRVGDTPARMLVTSTPSGFERFVTEVAEFGEPTPEAVTEIGARHDIEILGPPGTLP